MIMSKGSFKEEKGTRNKILRIVVFACLGLFVAFTVSMLIGLFLKKSAVMWIGVAGMWLSLLGIFIVGKTKK